MSNEENKTGYKSLDCDSLNEKITGTMLVISMKSREEDAAEQVFNHIKESYSVDELAFIASIHIGEKVKNALQENPRLVELVNMMRHLDDISKKYDIDDNKKSQN